MLATSKEEYLRLNAFIVLEHGGMTFHIMPFSEETASLSGRVRQFHKNHLYKNSYRGYSDEYDARFHQSGVYCFVLDAGEVVMTCRINTRSDVTPFPFELGDSAEGMHIYEGGEVAADINTYSLDVRKIKAMGPMMSCVGHYLYTARVARAFCLADTENGSIQKLYQKHQFVRSTDYAEPISFPTFTKEQVPVKWNIREWNKAAIENYAQKYLELKSHKQKET